MTPPRKLVSALAVLLSLIAVAVEGIEVDYKVDLGARWSGTAHEGNIELPPSLLFKVFGQPLLDDGDSESFGTYVFTSKEGKVLTVYYRAYEVPRTKITETRAAFWKQELEVDFHIGAKQSQDVPAFKAWLTAMLAREGV